MFFDWHLQLPCHSSSFDLLHFCNHLGWCCFLSQIHFGHVASACLHQQYTALFFACLIAIDLKRWCSPLTSSWLALPYSNFDNWAQIAPMNLYPCKSLCLSRLWWVDLSYWQKVYRTKSSSTQDFQPSRWMDFSCFGIGLWVIRFSHLKYTLGFKILQQLYSTMLFG